MRSARRWMAVAVIGAVLVAAWVALPGPQAVIGELGALRGRGIVGMAWFAALYVLATVAFVPGGILQGAAGFLYGPVGGFLFAWPAGVAAGSVSFLFARTVLRDLVEQRLAGRLHALDRALASRGTEVVALLRISPISPFNAVHYGLGATGVTWAQFAVGTAIGSVPPCFLFVYIGSNVADLADLLDRGGAPELGWTHVAGLGLTAVATLGITWVARNALAKLEEVR